MAVPGLTNARLRWVSALGLVVSIGALIALVAWQGAATIASVLGNAGWIVLLLGPLFLVPHLLHTEAWFQLSDPRRRPRRRWFLSANWIAFGINWLLPSARVGGDIVKARLLQGRGVPGAAALASVVAHKTLQPLVLVAHALLGVALLIGCYGLGGAVGPVLVVSTALGLALSAFVVLQRRGMFGPMARLAARFAPGVLGSQWAAEGAALDGALRDSYGHRARLVAAVGLLLGFRLALSLELWWVLYLLGHPVTFADALILDGLTQAVRAAAFILPAGLGAQEGGFVAVGLLLGVPQPVALSASLLRRVRELEVGVPALLLWQWSLGRGLLGRWQEPRDAG